MMNKCLILVALASVFSVSCSNDLIGDLKKYVRFDNKGHYAGLSDYSKKLITQTRDVLRKRKDLFQGQFRQFESIFHTAHVNRLAQGNVFLYGPPGGAKSKFVRWMFANEKEPAFELQMHQMMTEQVFVGGQNYNAAREGRFEINTEGSLAGFKVALIDEIDKGNPAALAALLSLLNERQVLAGNKVIKSKLETIFSTSNANLYEIHQQFTENGLRSTAAALLNRFTSVAFIPNWLPKNDQAALDHALMAELDDLFKERMATSTGHESKVASLELDWEGLRGLARCMLRFHEEFFSVSREFLDALRTQTIETVEALKDSQQTSYNAEDALPYHPTAEYTERLRQRIHDIVFMSILLDVIASPMTNDITNLENTLKNIQYHRLPIGPLSLWRAYLTLTTVTFGNVRLLFPTQGSSNKDITIDFGEFFSKNKGSLKAYKPKDKREEQNINYLIQEQQAFKNTFMKVVEKHHDVLKDTSAFSGLFSCMTDNQKMADMNDIERILFAFAQR